MHWVLKLVSVLTVPIPPLKMVRTTRAATRMTTAVTTIIMVVESAFII